MPLAALEPFQHSAEAVRELGGVERAPALLDLRALGLQRTARTDVPNPQLARISTSSGSDIAARSQAPVYIPIEWWEMCAASLPTTPACGCSDTALVAIRRLAGGARLGRPDAIQVIRDAWRELTPLVDWLAEVLDWDASRGSPRE